MKKYLIITFYKCSRTTKLISVLIDFKIEFEILNILDFLKLYKKCTKNIKTYFNNFNRLIISGSCKYELNNKYVGCKTGTVCDIINVVNKIYKLFTNKPVLGICYGMEILGILHGSKVINIPKTIKNIMNISKSNIGNKMVEVNKKYKIFNRIKSKTKFNHTHKKILDIKKIPKKINIIATSNYGIAGIKINKKRHYGFQFHPESSKKQGLKLIKNFLEL